MNNSKNLKNTNSNNCTWWSFKKFEKINEIRKSKNLQIQIRTTAPGGVAWSGVFPPPSPRMSASIFTQLSGKSSGDTYTYSIDFHLHIHVF